MRNDRRAILSLVALGRITPAEAERLLLICNNGPDSFWIFAACFAATLFTFVLHQGLIALLHVSRFLLTDDPLHRILSVIHRLSGGIQ
jgi:hypothetical protein